jgi:hypothetical protein
MIIAMLTTVDNPYNPFDQWDEWYAYDVRSGHNSTSFLARIATLSDDLSEADENAALMHAIDEIITENVNGMYRKVEREVPD